MIDSEKKCFFDCIFDGDYTPDIEKAYDKYYYLKDWRWDLEYIFSMEYEYLGMVKGIENWRGLNGGWEMHMVNGEPTEYGYYILFKDNKLLPYKLTVSPLWADNTRNMLWSKIEDSDDIREVNIDMNGKITYIEEENDSF